MVRGLISDEAAIKFPCSLFSIPVRTRSLCTPPPRVSHCTVMTVSAASQAVGDSGRSASASGRAADNSHDPPGHRSERAAHSSVTAVSSSERATNLEEDGRLIDDSWTVRELKAECGRRGLRRFARLTKPDLLTLLRRGVSIHNPFCRQDE